MVQDKCGPVTVSKPGKKSDQTRLPNTIESVTVFQMKMQLQQYAHDASLNDSKINLKHDHNL